MLLLGLHVGPANLFVVSRTRTGRWHACKGIAEGVENSNYLVDTTQGRFVLTLYEKRVAAGDLPFFMALLDHLAVRGVPAPPAVPDRDGRTIHELEGRPACLIRFLPGVSVTHPTVHQARAAGLALRDLHRAVADFPETRRNDLGIESWAPLLARCGRDLDVIAPGLHDTLARSLDAVLAAWPADGEACVIHADLFPDNVLMLGDRVTGLIDFYFACTDLKLYDLAVMHSAWAFDGTGARHRAEVGAALLDGYGATAEERAILPVLARGASIRFSLTRGWDWLNTPADALVTRKDPLAYVRRLQKYETEGLF